jgi:hypothetical protein
MPKLVTSDVGVRGLLCPWCLLIVQPLPAGTVEQGLARHLQVVHPDRA